MKLDIGAVQEYLAKEKMDGWLLYDFRGLNNFAQDLAPFSGILTRRWYLLIPRQGKPVLLAHKIEESSVRGDWMERRFYSSWKVLDEELRTLLKNMGTVAMEYSPLNAVPYVSKVDAGTIEKIRSFDVEVVSSANLIQYFYVRWSEAGLASHRRAARFLVDLVPEMFQYVANALNSGKSLTEREVQLEVMSRQKEKGMVWDHEPIVSVSGNAALPHYAPSADVYAPIKKGDLLLLDLFCREDGEDTISADITWTAYLGKEVPEKMQKIFDIVIAARDAGVELIKNKLSAGEPVAGWQVDDAVRAVIDKAGYGQYFPHRTGHSLGKAAHGDGANMDNFETRDERLLLPGLGFTIEPGIYLPGEFGIRSEINCYIGENGIEVTTLPLQTEFKAILG